MSAATAALSERRRRGRECDGDRQHAASHSNDRLPNHGPLHVVNKGACYYCTQAFPKNANGPRPGIRAAGRRLAFTPSTNRNPYCWGFVKSTVTWPPAWKSKIGRAHV